MTHHSKITAMSPILSLLLFLSTPPLASSLSPDGILLLAFRYSILNDPLNVLSSWNYDDATPCSWNGVVCNGFSTSSNASSSIDPFLNFTTTTSRVISLVLPSSQLLGSIPADLGFIEHLQHLDLSNNFLNGTLPSSLFNASELKVVSFANNEISGELPELIGRLNNLQLLNLSDNALAGTLPKNLTLLPNLTAVSLSNNYLSGSLPNGGFEQLKFLDLSSNLINGSVPDDLGVDSIHFLNLSYNKISGEIPRRVGLRIPPDAVVDLSYNNLTGAIPQSAAFLAQKPMAFAGNADLCGKPLRNLCTIPSTLSNPQPNVSVSNPNESPPAFAAIPKTTAASNASGTGQNSSSNGQGGFKPATIAAIVIGDLGGIGLLVVVFLYAYHVKKKKKKMTMMMMNGDRNQELKRPSPYPSPPESKGDRALACCMRKKNNQDETSGTSGCSSETETEEEEQHESREKEEQKRMQNQQEDTLVVIDGDVELEMETLLKASAYILGATGLTIVYKAVLADGTALAVRRIGESSVIDKLKDFEAQVRSIAKFKHPNLLRIWGFYWGPDEKLLIHDYAPNGSLANISFSKKLGSMPFHLNFETRLRIARGLARGLAYIHEKRSIHGNLKPSNVLLNHNFEATIGDFGLDRLLSNNSATKPGSSARLFGSKRSMQSQASLGNNQDLSPVPNTSPLSLSSVPYQAPESSKNLRPNAKWDVYSFGMILLELMSGRVFSEEELCQWNAGFVVEERSRVIRMSDSSLRGEVEGKEEALLSCFKLGFACASTAAQRRPTMKDVVMLLDRIPAAASSSSATSTAMLI